MERPTSRNGKKTNAGRLLQLAWQRSCSHVEVLISQLKRGFVDSANREHGVPSPYAGQS